MSRTNLTTAKIIAFLALPAFIFGTWLGPGVGIVVPLIILLVGVGTLITLRLIAVKMKGIK